MMLRIDDSIYIVKRIFSFDMVKSEDALRDIMHYYGGADTLIKDNKNNKYLLTQRVDDAIILSETYNEESETKQINDSNSIQE